MIRLHLLGYHFTSEFIQIVVHVYLLGSYFTQSVVGHIHLLGCYLTSVSYWFYFTHSVVGHIHLLGYYFTSVSSWLSLSLPLLNLVLRLYPCSLALLYAPYLVTMLSWLIFGFSNTKPVFRSSGVIDWYIILSTLVHDF